MNAETNTSYAFARCVTGTGENESPLIYNAHYRDTRCAFGFGHSISRFLSGRTQSLSNVNALGRSRERRPDSWRANGSKPLAGSTHRRTTSSRSWRVLNVTWISTG